MHLWNPSIGWLEHVGTDIHWFQDVLIYLMIFQPRVSTWDNPKTSFYIISQGIPRLKIRQIQVLRPIQKTLPSCILELLSLALQADQLDADHVLHGNEEAQQAEEPMAVSGAAALHGNARCEKEPHLHLLCIIGVCLKVVYGHVHGKMIQMRF